uniref:Uncharacterized protein n=1 Tax=Paramoeba aestuarina TaxID=180227 RepID=A0A7S4NEX9_9EUKA|mmetsp:Transcript_15344/g.24006  ORF Transcript_15344/g.24006 Transcript_15344/m.24006 type:complete len:369 (+) Transcript_15344:72-1178(+)
MADVKKGGGRPTWTLEELKQNMGKNPIYSTSMGNMDTTDFPLVDHSGQVFIANYRRHPLFDTEFDWQSTVNNRVPAVCAQNINCMLAMVGTDGNLHTAQEWSSDDEGEGEGLQWAMDRGLRNKKGSQVVQALPSPVTYLTSTGKVYVNTRGEQLVAKGVSFIGQIGRQVFGVIDDCVVLLYNGTSSWDKDQKIQDFSCLDNSKIHRIAFGGNYVVAETAAFGIVIVKDGKMEKVDITQEITVTAFSATDKTVYYLEAGVDEEGDRIWWEGEKVLEGVKVKCMMSVGWGCVCLTEDGEVYLHDTKGSFIKQQPEERKEKRRTTKGKEKKKKKEEKKSDGDENIFPFALVTGFPSPSLHLQGPKSAKKGK